MAGGEVVGGTVTERGTVGSDGARTLGGKEGLYAGGRL